MKIQVSTILNKVKANSKTYQGLERSDMLRFQDLYNYLKKHKDKEFFNAVHNSFHVHLNNKNISDYVSKYKAMQVIAHSISH